MNGWGAASMAKVKEMMNKGVLVINQEKTVADALAFMQAQRLNGAPVVDNENRLVGMVVKADIYRFLMEPGHYDNYPLRLVMSKEVVTAYEDDDVIETVIKLRRHNIVAVPVVRDQQVVGLVSIEDVIDYFLQKQG